MIVLPTQITPAETGDPKFLVLFGDIKQGKSTICSILTQEKENAIVIDLKDEYAFLNARKYVAKSLTDLSQFIASVTKKNQEIGDYYYKYIVIDNASYLEELVLPLANAKYKKTEMGKNWTGDDVTLLPQGSGYRFLREAFFEVLSYFRDITKHLILVCHLKDRLVDKDGEEQTELSINLTGKISQMVGRDSDALGYIFRKENETKIKFNGSGRIIAQSRCDHLRGREIVISESDEDGNITAHWDRIYKEYNNNATKQAA